MYVLVSYDVVDDRTRGKVMRFLKDFGERVQLSVFECDMDEDRCRRMKTGLLQLIDSEKDRVRCYRLCRDCLDRVVVSGWGEVPRDEGFELV